MAAPNGTEIALGAAGSSALGAAIYLPMLSDWLQIALFGAAGAFIGCAARKDLTTIGKKAISALTGLSSSMAFSWIGALYISDGVHLPVQVALHFVPFLIGAIGDLWVHMIPPTLKSLRDIVLSRLRPPP